MPRGDFLASFFVPVVFQVRLYSFWAWSVARKVLLLSFSGSQSENKRPQESNKQIRLITSLTFQCCSSYLEFACQGVSGGGFSRTRGLRLGREFEAALPLGFGGA